MNNAFTVPVCFDVASPHTKFAVILRRGNSGYSQISRSSSDLGIYHYLYFGANGEWQILGGIKLVWRQVTSSLYRTILWNCPVQRVIVTVIANH